MNAIMDFLLITFNAMIFVFTVTNMFNMGIQVNIDNVITELKKKKAVALIFVWGFVLGPALAYLIAWVLHLDAPYVIGLLITSLAPVSAFLPLVVESARGDMNFAAALVPLATAGTVFFMPLLLPLMIPGVAVSAWDIAQPLILTVLLPLVIGIAVRHLTESVAKKIFPAVNLIAKITTLGAVVWTVVVFARPMIETVASLALLSALLFMVGIGLVSYLFGFGLKQSQRSVISLAMLTRNSGSQLIAALAIPFEDVRILASVITYIVIVNVGGFILAPIAARIFGRQAGETNGG